MSSLASLRYYVILTALLLLLTSSAFGQSPPEKVAGTENLSSKESVPSGTDKSEWYAGYNGELQFEIELSSLQREGNIIYFWEKTTWVSAKKREEFIEAQLNYIKRSYPQGIPQDINNKWSRYKYTMTRYVIDCNNALNRGLSMAYYDNDEKIIDSVDTPEPNWTRILPDSIGMEKYQFICKYQ